MGVAGKIAALSIVIRLLRPLKELPPPLLHAQDKQGMTGKTGSRQRTIVLCYTPARRAGQGREGGTMPTLYEDANMEKILLPFDGSESATRALHRVCDQVKARPGSEVLLLHVVDPWAIDPETGSWQRADKSAFLDEGERVLAPARQVLDDAGVAYQKSVVFGSPGNEIAAHAKRNGCTAIVMGTRGLSATASLFVGSVAQRVMQFTDVPVTLVK